VSLTSSCPADCSSHGNCKSICLNVQHGSDRFPAAICESCTCHLSVSLSAVRLWGKIFEGAAAAKSDFDAASLTSFLWAASTAGVHGSIAAALFSSGGGGSGS